MKKLYFILALVLSSTNVLADDSGDLEKSLPITFNIALNPQRAGICLAANSVLANEVNDFRESAKQINAVLWAVIDEKQGKFKADITEQIANENANAMKNNIDWTIRQMKSRGCSEMNVEITKFLEKKS